MAKAHVIPVNIPMAAALRRMLVRNECPVCLLTVEEHSAIALSADGKIITCSNDSDDKRRKIIGK